YLVWAETSKRPRVCDPCRVHPLRLSGRGKGDPSSRNRARDIHPEGWLNGPREIAGLDPHQVDVTGLSVDLGTHEEIAQGIEKAPLLGAGLNACGKGSAHLDLSLPSCVFGARRASISQEFINGRAQVNQICEILYIS